MVILEKDYDKILRDNERMRSALVSVKEWIMDPFGPEDFNKEALHPAFLKALKKVHEALAQ